MWISHVAAATTWWGTTQQPGARRTMCVIIVCTRALAGAHRTHQSSRATVSTVTGYRQRPAVPAWPGRSVGHAESRTQPALHAAHRLRCDRAHVGAHLVVVDSFDIVAGCPAGHDLPRAKLDHRRAAVARFRRGQPDPEHLLERPVPPVVGDDKEVLVLLNVAQVGTVDAAAQ